MQYSSSLFRICTVILGCALGSLFGQSTSGCQPTWQMFNNTQSIGATRHPELTDLPSCLNACVVDGLCVGVDWAWSKDPPECWVHMYLNVVSSQTQVFGVNQYIIKRTTYSGNLTCTPAFTMIANVHSLGGQAVTSQDGNLSGCLDYCNAMVNCTAVDYRIDRSRACYVHNNSVDPPNLFNRDKVYQFRRTNSDFCT